MQTLAAFHLWPRLHQDLLRVLDRVPPGRLDEVPPGTAGSLGDTLRRAAAAEEQARRLVLERDAGEAAAGPETCPDAGSLRTRLAGAFAATESLLRGSLVEALAERPVTAALPARNALEALSLAYTRTVHLRGEALRRLAALGVEPEDWL